MAVVIPWIILSFIFGAIGSNRKIGFAGAFFASLLLSPLIGLIITLVSEKRDFKREGAETLHQKASRKLDKGEYQEALDMYKQVLKMNGNHPQTHLNLAKCYSNLDNNSLALKHLARSVDLGFSDYEKIETDSQLQGLRETEEFKEFSKKGYKL